MDYAIAIDLKCVYTYSMFPYCCQGWNDDL